MSEQDSLIIAMLERIRERPAMYLPERSISLLDSYLQGYNAALSDAGYRQEDGNEGIMTGFQRFVEKRFKIKLSVSWANILRFVNSSDAFAFVAFWEIWDEYLTQRRRARKKP